MDIHWHSLRHKVMTPAVTHENHILYFVLWIIRASLVAQMVKNLPAMQETWV